MFLFFVLFIPNNVVNAHSGRTDGAGGHCNYTTGYYHYHTGPNAGKSFPSEECGYNSKKDDYSQYNDTNSDSDSSMLPLLLIGGGIVAFIIYKKRKE